MSGHDVSVFIRRRARRDIALGRFLRMRQEWRRRDDRTVWRVRGIYRADCEVMLGRGIAPNGRDDLERTLVTFAQLRQDWLYIARPQETAAA